MPLIRLNRVHVAFGVDALLDSAELQIDEGERVGLLGRNGEGKSTLLNIIAGKIQPESGEVWRQPELKLAHLEQAPLLREDSTVYDAVADGLGEIGNWLTQFHELSACSEHNADSRRLKELGNLQHLLDTHNGWLLKQRVESTLSRLALDGDVRVSTLSGGWRRRVALAAALVSNPQLLLLDEPTNHLDIETIIWLEEQLSQFAGAIIFITHDRAFLQNLASRIVDLDRGKLVAWPGSYAEYLSRKADVLEQESRRMAEFDKKLAKEEIWIRQGIKARRTRNEGRVRALKKLREERARRREQQQKPSFQVEAAEGSGKRVIVARSVNFRYENTVIVKDLTTTIVKGDRVGLIGDNGSGKSTLLRLLVGENQPTSGTVKIGTNIETAYFDQMRERLDPDMTVLDSIAEGNEFISINGRKRHIMSYMMDFLFTPARARSPVRSLSGGEKNRLLLARLFSKPANLLVMDEPTNDLDVETLELLEDLLVKFDGTLLLVSHDRAFLDKVVTSTLVFEGEGRIEEYVGGYSDWLNQSAARETNTPPVLKAPVKRKSNKTRPKLSFQQKKDLEALPAQIESMENEQAALSELTSSAEFYQQDKDTITQTLEHLKRLEKDLKCAYSRWDELESLSVDLQNP